MKKITAIIVLLTVVFFSQNIFADTEVPSGNKSVKVKADTKKNAATIDRLNKGESVEYIQSVQNWYYVKLNDGTEGYVSKSSTRLIPSTTSTSNGSWTSGNFEIHVLKFG
jgi:SH3-like domain-containing protein